jgi:hypothetical protein
MASRVGQARAGRFLRVDLRALRRQCGVLMADELIELLGVKGPPWFAAARSASFWGSCRRTFLYYQVAASRAEPDHRQHDPVEACAPVPQSAEAWGRCSPTPVSPTAPM